MIIPATELIPVDLLKVDGKNPNVMKPKTFAALKKNISKYGFLVPIITNKDLIIADGEHRLKAAQELGFLEVPVVKIEFSEVDRKIVRQVMNKLRGEHDSLLDEDEFKFIYDNEGWTDLKELLDLADREEVQFLAKLKPLEEESFIPSKTVKYDVKLGEVYLLGRHRLLCGDATKKADVEKLMNGQKAIMTFTDPPYNVSYGWNKFEGSPGRFKNREIINDKQSDESWLLFVREYIKRVLDYTEGAVYICMSNKEMYSNQQIFKEEGGHWSSFIIWDKKYFVLSRQDYHRQYEPILYDWKEGNKNEFYGGRDQSDIWQVQRPFKSELHPTMKPVELIVKAINNSSKENDIILDFFGGSGSTLIAAEQTGRTCYMMELSPEYCSVIIERWENLTSQKARKEGAT